jgi:hypothetical protein
VSASDSKKEALFNEVKGSLFEFLIAKKLSVKKNDELGFLKSLDKNYLNVLGQQDRMVRQFYPEMLPFLEQSAMLTAEVIFEHFQGDLLHPRLLGKFSNSSTQNDETDIIVTHSGQEKKLSIKLNKKNSYVNTKSGGIKSFFQVYFPFLSSETQSEFNQFVDLEFTRMGLELHECENLIYPGNFSSWVASGRSELPGELNDGCRTILHDYYSRISAKMNSVLLQAYRTHPEEFKKSLGPLMGFTSTEIAQVICFHDFKHKDSFPAISVHEHGEIAKSLEEEELSIEHQKASVQIDFGPWSLQIRVKPMNKFTTTAIKVNCSIKFKRPSAS